MTLQTHRIYNLLLFSTLSLFFGWLASWRFISLGGLAPNLLIIIVIAALFLNFDRFEISLIFLTGLITLLWRPSLTLELLALIITAGLLVLSHYYFSLNSFSNLVILTLIATLLFYLFHSPTFIFSFPLLVLFEGLINCLGAAVLVAAGRLLTIS